MPARRVKVWLQQHPLTASSFFCIIFGVLLESPWWLLDAFWPQNFGRWWRPTNYYFAQKSNTASVVVTPEVVWTINHYKMVKKIFELSTIRGDGDIKTFQLSLAP